MSASIIERSALRAALMTWRDDATLAALTLMQNASVTAIRALEGRLDEIAVVDAMTGADRVASALVLPAMRDAVGFAADAWFTTYARTLRQVDPRLEALALRFADLGERPILPPGEDLSAARWNAPAWLRATVDPIGSAIGRAASGVAHRAVPAAVRGTVGQVSTRIGHELGERSGAHDRLRAAAQDELTRRWLGPAPDDAAPRPYLAQLFDSINRTAAQAREIVG